MGKLWKKSRAVFGCESDMNTSFDTVLQCGLQNLNISLNADQVSRIRTYADQLTLWNKKINLTAIRKPDQVAEKHFIDAMAVFPLIQTTQRLIDIGTGGGFPGLVLKILKPEMEVTLVDSVRKKVNFLKHMIRTLGLAKIEAVHERVENLHQTPGYPENFDMAVSRAFSELGTFVDLASPLVRPNGVICAMKGKDADKEISDRLKETYAITRHDYRLPVEKSDRTILILKPAQTS